jgi:hypothetical protein
MRGVPTQHCLTASLTHFSTACTDLSKDAASSGDHCRRGHASSGTGVHREELSD